uniref:Truncated ganglioside differentiation associated protein 1 n=1 Tax=Homo sapiens TaxID=9606 RepID=E7FJF5_HUMAN|nr:truncated ganglioside differentiation associated protein 1 [Homo sapiens]
MAERQEEQREPALEGGRQGRRGG